MAYTANELFAGPTNQAAGLRIFPKHASPKTFGNGSAVTLAVGTAVAFNNSTGKWQAWGAVASEVQRINLGAASAGTVIITFDGAATTAIAFNASNATIQAALDALPNINPGDVVVSGGAWPGTNVTLTFAGQYTSESVPEITAVGTGLTGGTITIVTATAGVEDNGSDLIKGFVFPDPIIIDVTNDVLGVVMTSGDIHYADIPVPAGSTLSQLKEALRDGPRALDLFVTGLDAVR